LSGRDYIPCLFQEDYVGAENGFAKALLRSKWALRARSRALVPAPAVFRSSTGIAGPAARSPWLRRKSGLCYTAGANSPFEAYNYVC